MDTKELGAKELRTKNIKELSDILVEVSEEFEDIKFQSATGQVENTSRIKILRRSIARIKTLLTEKESMNTTVGQE